MAHICEFKMQLKGKRTNIDKFVNALTRKGRVYIGDGISNTDISILEYNSLTIAMITGNCKWSVWSALIGGAEQMQEEKKQGVNNPVIQSADEIITLFEACRCFNVNMEVYSKEPECKFQEHYKYENGNSLGDLVNYTETIDDKTGEVTITGGYKSWYFDLQDVYDLDNLPSIPEKVILQDSTLKELWEELEDVMFIEAKDFFSSVPVDMVDITLVLESDWRGFKAGITQEPIWKWFDIHSGNGLDDIIGSTEHQSADADIKKIISQFPEHLRKSAHEVKSISGMLYDYVNDKYYYSVEDFYDTWNNSNTKLETRPQVLFATVTTRLSLNAEELLEEACEDLHEDAFNRIEEDDIKELQEFLDKWCNKQKSVTETYYPDYSRYIRIDESQLR